MAIFLGSTAIELGSEKVVTRERTSENKVNRLAIIDQTQCGINIR